MTLSKCNRSTWTPVRRLDHNCENLRRGTADEDPRRGIDPTGRDPPVRLLPAAENRGARARPAGRERSARAHRGGRHLPLRSLGHRWSRERPLPMLLGHEAAGTIVEKGPGVQHLEVGERVVAAFLPRCGECSACRTNGRLPCIPGSEANRDGVLLGGSTRLHRGTTAVAHHLGVSAFATHAVVDARSVVAVGADVPPNVAALLGCAVLTGGGAVLNSGRPSAGQTVAIVGLAESGWQPCWWPHRLRTLQSWESTPTPARCRSRARVRRSASSHTGSG